MCVLISTLALTVSGVGLVHASPPANVITLTLPVPTFVVASDGTSTAHVRISWVAVAGATHYRVSRAISEGGAKTDLGAWQVGTQYDDTAATPGVTYYYFVRASVDGADVSGYSDYDTGWRKLGVPTGVAASDGTATAHVRVTWNAVDGATHYRISRATSSLEAKTDLGVWQTGRQYDDTAVTPGVMYYYFVRAAVDANGTRASSYSASDGGWRPLAAPTGVAATDGTSTAHVRVTWSAVTGAMEYRVSRATSPDGPKTDLGVWQSGLQYDDTTTAVTPGVTYYYYIRAAVDADGTRAGGYSDYDTGWRALGFPTGVDASNGTYTEQVRVYWNAVTGATHYRISRTTSADGSNKTDLGVWQTGRQYDDTAVTPGVMYYYFVRAAVDANGTRASSYSASDGGWRPLAAPTGVAATDGTSTAHVRVTWSAVTGAMEYRVSRATSPDGPKTDLGVWQSGLQYDDTTTAVTPGVTYYYYIRAAVTAGARASDYSVSDTGWRALAAPTGVAASYETSAAYVRVTWSTVTGATHYRVSRATSAGGAKTDLGEWHAGLQFDDTSATPGVEHYYFVRAAVDAFGTRAGDYSDYRIGLRALDAPTGVAASDGTSAAHVRVTWNGVADATHYRVSRATTQGGAKTDLGPWQTGTQYDDTSATPGVTYYYFVRAAVAVDGLHAGNYSASDDGWRALAAPAGVAASDGTSTAHARVTWSAVTSATHYRVSRATSAGGAKTDLGAWQSGTSYDDTSATPGVLYYYFVRAAVDANGTRAGDYSASETGWRSPTAPTGVTATDGTSAAHVSITWSAVTGGTHYRVSRSTSEGGTKTDLGLWQSGLQYDDTSATPGVTYYYYVRAAGDVNGARAGGYSASDTGWRALAAPTGVTAQDGSSHANVMVIWNAITGATHYRVSRSTSEGGAKTDLGAWQTGTVYSDTSATPGVTYYYYIRAAVDADGTRASGYSASDSGWRALPAPTGVTASDGTFAAYARITWNAVDGATHYRVYRATSQDGTQTGLGAWQSGLQYDDAGGAPSVIYYYFVRAAVDANGTRIGHFSTSDTGWRALAAPTGVMATDGTSGAHVRVTWSTVENATHYRVSRATSVNGSNTDLGAWQVGTQYDDTTATPGVTYYYFVRAALNSSGAYASGYSVSDTGWRTLVAPTSVAASDGTSGAHVRVTWSTVTGATHYLVSRATTAGGSKTDLGAWQAGTQYDDTGATPAVQYYYFVRAAVDANGTYASGYSASDTGWRAQASLPDFVVQSITLYPTTVADGGTVTATITIRNQGDSSGDAGRLDMFIHQASPAVPPAAGDGYISAGSTASGETKVFQHVFTATGVGAKTYRTLIDSFGSTAESNEANNEGAAAYSVVRVYGKGYYRVRSATPTTLLELRPDGTLFWHNAVLGSAGAVQAASTLEDGGDWLDIVTFTATESDMSAKVFVAP